MTEQILEQNPKNKKNRRPKWSSLFWWYFMSLSIMFIGFEWLNDINTKGYYVDEKHQMSITDEDGLITVYTLIIGGICMLAYSIYSTLLRYGKNNNKKRG